MRVSLSFLWGCTISGLCGFGFLVFVGVLCVRGTGDFILQNKAENNKRILFVTRLLYIPSQGDWFPAYYCDWVEVGEGGWEGGWAC